MAAYLVAYDLNSPGQHHAKLLAEIKNFAWAKLSESAYAINPGKFTVDQVLALFRAAVDKNDTIYVINLRRPYTGYGPTEVNKWLENNLPLP